MVGIGTVLERCWNQIVFILVGLGLVFIVVADCWVVNWIYFSLIGFILIGRAWAHRLTAGVLAESNNHGRPMIIGVDLDIRSIILIELNCG